MILTSNIINNKQSSDEYAAIFTSANLLINESCILGNNEDNIVFYEYSSSCQIRVTNCTLDSDIITKNTRYHGSFIIISSKEYSFINALTHIVTEKCKSSYDSYGTLTVAVDAQKKGTKNYMKTNDAFLTFFQYLCIITLLPSLSTKCVPYLT